jgi:hypothetical protein
VSVTWGSDSVGAGLKEVIGISSYNLVIFESLSKKLRRLLRLGNVERLSACSLPSNRPAPIWESTQKELNDMEPEVRGEVGAGTALPTFLWAYKKIKQMTAKYPKNMAAIHIKTIVNHNSGTFLIERNMFEKKYFSVEVLTGDSELLA